MINLRPCPLCGGAVQSFGGYYLHGDWVWPKVVCQCGLIFTHVKFPATYPESLVEAWNGGLDRQNDLLQTIKLIEKEATGQISDNEYVIKQRLDTVHRIARTAREDHTR